MPDNVHSVSIGELVVSKNIGDTLVAYGLGSCVAVCLYDPVARVGGMIHSLLPNASQNNGAQPPTAKFVDQGVPLLIEKITRAGAILTRLDVYLCGGAQMLSAPGFKNSLNIGERNVQAAETALRVAGLRILGRSTGGNSGRTVRMLINTGEVTVKTLGQGEQVLSRSLIK